MTGSLVFMNDVFVGDAVDDTAGFLENLGGSGFVAGFDGLANALDGRAQHRAQAGIMFVKRYGLTCAFAGLCCIGHKCVLLTFKGCPSCYVAVLVYIACQVPHWALKAVALLHQRLLLKTAYRQIAALKVT